MGMVIRFEPPFAYLETLHVLRVRLSAQPMPFVLVQEDLKRCNAPSFLALFAKPTHICQSGVRSDEQDSLTDGRASSNLDNLAVLPFALTLLFLHGTVDTNVPVGESIQMFTALKLLGKPTAFVQVVGQNHQILDYKKRAEWNKTIYAWFAKWLKNQPEWWNAMYPEKSL